MNKKIYLFCWLVALLRFSNIASAEEWQTYLQAHSFSYSEATSVHSLTHEFNNDLDSGRIAFTHNSLELGVGYQGWRIGYISRYEMYVDYAQDSIELFYLKGNDLPVTPNRVYQVDIEVNRVKANGLKVGYGFHVLPTLRLRYAMARVNTSEILEGEVAGALAIEEDSYSGDLTLDYSFTEDLVLHRAVEKPKGRGYTFDMNIDWQITPQWRSEFAVVDLYSKIEWNKTPHNDVAITSSTTNFNESGFIETTPMLQGSVAPKTFSQRLPKKFDTKLIYSGLDQYLFEFSHHYVHGTSFPQIGIGYQTNQGDLGFAYFPEQQAVQLSYSLAALQIRYTSSATNWDDAKLLALELVAAFFF